VKFQTLLYYKYATLPDAEVLAKRMLKFCKNEGLKGRILVSDEGINGTVSGSVDQCAAYIKYIEAIPEFDGIEWKIDSVEHLSFNKMHVRYRKELVAFNDSTQSIDPNIQTGVHLSPEDFKAMKDDDDVVVLDTRNNYEWEVGKFKDAITLDIDTFRDFPKKLKEIEKLKGKKIIAYCTGGIRCEKATALMLENGFDDVYQLHGGIINYGKQTGGTDFEGKCYVFDKRITVDVNDVNPSVISTCETCGTTSTRFVNCADAICNDHFIQCTSCSEKLKGCCSEKCMNSDTLRSYDGTGYYAKGNSENNNLD